MSTRQAAVKRYVVTLSAEERERLKGLICSDVLPGYSGCAGNGGGEVGRPLEQDAGLANLVDVDCRRCRGDFAR